MSARSSLPEPQSPVSQLLDVLRKPYDAAKDSHEVNAAREDLDRIHFALAGILRDPGTHIAALAEISNLSRQAYEEARKLWLEEQDARREAI